MSAAEVSPPAPATAPALRQDSLLALASRLLGTALGVVLTAFLAATLGPREFGVYAWVIASTSLLEVPAALGFPTGVVRLIARYRFGGDEALAKASAQHALRTASFVGSGVALAALVPLALLATRSDRGVFMPALAVGLALVPLGGYLAVLQGVCRAYQRIALAVLPTQVLAPVLALLGAGAASWVLPALGAWQFLALLLLIRVCLALGQRLAFSATRQHDTPPAVATAAQRREWNGLAWQLAITDGSWLLLRSADVVLVGLLRGATEAGIYALASRAAELLSFGLLAVRFAAAPAYAQLAAAHDRQGLQRLVRQAALWVIGPTTLAAILLVWLDEPILRLVWPEFAAAQAPLAVLALGHWLSAAFGPVGTLLSLSGHERDAARVVLTTALFNVALNAVAISLYGGLGAAWATTCSALVVNFWSHLLVRRRLGIEAGLTAWWSRS